MKHKLLVADDSLVIQKTVDLVLAEGDFRVDAVSDGRLALDMIQSQVPDIVLAAVNLPEINGYDVCRTVKENSDLQAVQVILLAPAVEGIDQGRARDAGADEYIIKPFEADELLSKINVVLASKGLIAELRSEVAALGSELAKARQELEKSQEQADQATRDLSEKDETVASLNDALAEQKKLLELAEERAGEINREFVEGALQRVMPEITEKAIQEVLQGSLADDIKDAVEKSVEEKITDAVKKIITEEIEKL